MAYSVNYLRLECNEFAASFVQLISTTLLRIQLDNNRTRETCAILLVK